MACIMQDIHKPCKFCQELSIFVIIGSCARITLNVYVHFMCGHTIPYTVRVRLKLDIWLGRPEEC